MQLKTDREKKSETESLQHSVIAKYFSAHLPKSKGINIIT